MYPFLPKLKFFLVFFATFTQICWNLQKDERFLNFICQIWPFLTKFAFFLQNSLHFCKINRKLQSFWSYCSNLTFDVEFHYFLSKYYIFYQILTFLTYILSFLPRFLPKFHNIIRKGQSFLSILTFVVKFHRFSCKSFSSFCQISHFFPKFYFFAKFTMEKCKKLIFLQ